MKRSRRSRDAGFSLVEVLVTVVIMGIAFVVIVDGFYTAVVTTDHHRKQADVQRVLRNAAEAVKAASYVNCGTTTSYSSALPTANGNTVVATIGSVKYWSGTTYATTCPSSDNGLQLISLTVSTTARPHSQSVDVVKRRP